MAEKQAHPTEAPPFTLQDLRNAIPKHCFERSTWTSLRYTLVDVALVALLFAATKYINSPALPWFAPLLLWPLYWVCQGCIMTGCWVIAHECGHRAFSDNIGLGDAIGLFLHSSLLVPYHSWRISHAKHHANTNSMENDEVFIPYTRSEVGPFTPYEDIAPPKAFALRMVAIVKMLLFGWPVYLINHTTGKKYGKFTSHFVPSSPLFDDRQRYLVVISDIALVAVAGVLTMLGLRNGFGWLFCVYGVPYLIVNMWLVLITDLQHTDVRLPHFRGQEWTWLKGALCTIDRDYGFLNHVFHHIGDTHIAHHIFHRMPHYHAQEATRALIPVLGNYYTRTNVSPGLRGIWQALWDTTTNCVLVEDTGSAVYFKNK